MARLVLVRHAEPDSSWGQHPDPGLSALGVRQAEEAARGLAGFGRAPIVTSPLLRARQTAAPLERHVGLGARVEARFGEIVTPPGLSIPRVDWLRGILAARWSEADASTRAWRAELLEAVRATSDTTIAFTHFVAINVIVGAAIGDDRVWSCSPAHASVTVVDVDGDDLTVNTLGNQSETRVR
jgi:broad specificity phosphatase PhoE